MKSLLPDEILLEGKWIKAGNAVVADDTAERINFLVSNRLKMLSKSKDGWDSLYQDPNDGRYWELLYLQSELHGGGPPPSLKAISVEDAKLKYTNI